MQLACISTSRDRRCSIDDPAGFKINHPRRLAPEAGRAAARPGYLQTDCGVDLTFYLPSDHHESAGLVLGLVERIYPDANAHDARANGQCE